MSDHGGTGHRGTQAVKNLPKALELYHYVFISHLSSYYHNLGKFSVLTKGGEMDFSMSPRDQRYRSEHISPSVLKTSSVCIQQSPEELEPIPIFVFVDL